MKKKILAFIDWNRWVWVIEYRNSNGELVTEPTVFPASTPSIVVCDALQEASPKSLVFAKIA